MRAIQERAGHQDLRTTQRYMHLSPAALDEVIRLLEPRVSPRGGDILETPKLSTFALRATVDNLRVACQP